MGLKESIIGYAMKKYWFEFGFNENSLPFGIRMGCGLTAFDYSDALNLLSNKVFKDKPLPNIIKTIENIDVSTLDPGHVLPNMLSPDKRGIWFPPGYDM